MRFPDDVPVLSDGTVTLRAHTPSDIDGVVEQCTDPLSIEWTTVPVPYSRAEGERFVTEKVPAWWREESDLAFAIEAADRAGVRRFAGTTSLRPESDGVAEIAYGLAAWARGRGVMNRAVKLMLDWGFDQRDLAVVIWRANVGNWPSRRVAWANGFSFDGTVRQLLLQRGRRYDAWVGSLRAEDDREPKTRWLEVPVLEAGDVVLRPWRGTDLDRIVEACSDQRTRYWMPLLADPYTEDEARSFLLRAEESAALGAGLRWCVAAAGSDLALGDVGVFDLASGDPATAQMGYWTHPDSRGRGVATTAIRRLVEHCFAAPGAGGLGLHRLWLRAAAANAASCQVAEAARFTRVGVERSGYRLLDGYVDAMIYDLLATDARPGS